MKKPLVFALAAAAVLAAGAAQAGSNVYWSIGVAAPGVGTVISNAPSYYEPAPVYAYPPQVVYAPQPRVYYPPQVAYAPQPRVYYPPQVVYEQRSVPIYYQGARRHHDRDRDGIPDRYDRYDNRASRHGPYGDRDHDGIPNRYDRQDNRRYGY